jgi:hypothetical protein
MRWSPKHEVCPTKTLCLAARKLIEIASAVEAVQDGRIYIERVNPPFLAAGIERALGWLWRHESGTYAKFTDAGAALFA